MKDVKVTVSAHDLLKVIRALLNKADKKIDKPKLSELDKSICRLLMSTMAAKNKVNGEGSK